MTNENDDPLVASDTKGGILSPLPPPPPNPPPSGEPVNRGPTRIAIGIKDDQIVLQVTDDTGYSITSSISRRDAIYLGQRFLKLASRFGRIVPIIPKVVDPPNPPQTQKRAHQRLHNNE